MCTYCLDAYGSQLWPFYDKSVNLYYVAWRKTVRKLWSIPYTTHSRFLHTINDSLPIDILLEKRCLKFIWFCLNSDNNIIKNVTASSLKHSYSNLGENYRYFSYKYNITPYMWNRELSCIIKQLYNYVNRFHSPHHEAVMVRELCISIDNHCNQFVVFNAEEMCQLIEYLCTI